MEKDTENRSIDFTRAKGELEEDLLEYVYLMWRKEQQVTAKDFSREKNVSGHETAGLVRSLMKKGFLYETEKNEPLELTEKGQLEGMTCLARHEKITQFFQMVSGMEQQQAQEDACRVEHYISPEGLKGIENFLQYGDVYDRVYDGMDLYTFYGEGEFQMAFGLYEPERRNPRFLTAEYDKLEKSIILKISESKNYFILQVKEGENIGYLWYQRDNQWIRLPEKEGKYFIPTDIFTYRANTSIPITEAIAIIAITRFEQEPVMMDYRELNIHIW